MMKVMRRTVVGVLALTMLAGMGSAEALFGKKKKEEQDNFHNRMFEEKLLPRSVIAREMEGQTPVHKAILTLGASEGAGVVRRLLEKNKALVDQADPEHEIAPLHLTAYYGHNGTTETLLAKKANVNILDHQKATPLHYAVRGNSPSLITTLVDGEAEVDAKASGSTPLSDAITRHRADMVRPLLDNGASVSIKDEEGDTPLHEAIWYYKDLYDSLNAITRRTGTGATKLKNAKAIVRMLMEKGASTTVLNNAGETPLNQEDSLITIKEKREMGIIK